MSRAIVVTSGKGGVGKSTFCVCIGRALALRGSSVALVDTDVGLNNLDVIMAVENSVVYDLYDFQCASCRLSQALVPDPDYENLKLLPSSKGYGKDVLPQTLTKAVASLKTKFDYVFIDCPAGVDAGFDRAVKCADEAIVVTTPHVSAIKDAKVVVELLRARGTKRLSYVLNRVRPDLVISSQMASVEDVTDVLGVPPLGVILESDEVNGLSSVGSMEMSKETAEALDVLCDNLAFGKNVVYDYTKKYRGFLGALRRAIKTRI